MQNAVQIDQQKRRICNLQRGLRRKRAFGERRHLSQLKAPHHRIFLRRLVSDVEQRVFVTRNERPDRCRERVALHEALAHAGEDLPFDPATRPVALLVGFQAFAQRLNVAQALLLDIEARFLVEGLAHALEAPARNTHLCRFRKQGD